MSVEKKSEKNSENKNEETELDKKYWDMIHILAATYDEKNMDDVYIFFSSLPYLINPNLSNVGNKISDFTVHYQIENYMSSSERLFLWTYLCRFGKGNQEDSLEKIKNRYRPTSIDKTRWGNSYWYLIHSISKYLPQYPSEKILSIYYNFIQSFQNFLPCEKCRNHMSENLIKYPLKPYLKDRDYVFTWTVIFHNVVNVSLKKKYVKLEDAWLIY